MRSSRKGVLCGQCLAALVGALLSSSGPCAQANPIWTATTPSPVPLLALAPDVWWVHLLELAALAFSAGALTWLFMRRRVGKLKQHQALGESQTRLASILEQTSDFVSFSDPDGRLRYVNHAGRRLVGLGDDEPVGHRNLTTLHPPWAAAKVTGEALPAALSHGVWMGETALRHRDGREIPVSQVVMAHRKAGGELEFYSTIIRDIREAKRAEQACREREEIYRLVAEQTGQLVYDHDLASGQTRWAGAIRETTGYSPEEWGESAGRNWEQHIHPEDRLAVTQQREEARRRGGIFQLDYRFRRKDGTEVVLQDNAVVLRDTKGQPLRVLGALRDITHRRRAEQTRELLRRLSHQLTASLNARDIGLLLARTCREQFHHDAFFIDLIEEGSGRRIPVYCEDTPAGASEPQEVTSTIDPEHPQEITSVFRGQPVLVTREQEARESNLTRWGFKERLSRSLMFAPIICQGRGIGVISVQSYTPSAYAQKDLELLHDIAEQCGAAVLRAQADAALRQERNFSDTLLDTSGSLVVVLDPAGRIVRFNKACTAVTAYTFEEVVGRVLWDFLLLPEEAAAVKEVFDALAAGQFPNTHENAWVAKDGTPRLIAWSNTALLDKHGQVQFIIGTGMDITERRRAEEALRQSEERLRQALEAARMGTWDWDIARGTVAWSHNVPEIFGLNTSDLANTYEAYLKLIHPDDRQGVVEAIDDSLAGRRERYEVEHRILRADGSVRWLESKGQVHREGAGKPVRMSGTITDATGRKNAEQALKESEQRFQLAARGTNDGLWDWNMLNNHVYYSDRYKELLGYAPDEFPARYESFESHLHPEDRLHVSTAHMDHLTQRVPYDIEFRMRTKSGDYRWIRSRAQAIWDAAGRPVRMAGAHTDITDRKLAEEALRRNESILSRTNRIAQVGGWEYDVPTEELVWTAEVYHIHEVPSGFVPTLSKALQFFAPPDQPAVREAVERCLHHGESWDLECEFITEAGRRLWVRVRGEAQYEGGKVRRLVGALQDITRRKRAEEALRAVASGTAGVSGEQFLRSLVRHLAAALQVKYALVAELQGSPPARLRAVSVWADQQSGAPFEYDLDGTPAAEATPQRTVFYPHSVRSLFPKDALLRELQAESYLGVPLLDSQRRLQGLLVVLHDQPMVEGEESQSIVSIFAARAGAELERLQAEREILKLNVELEQRVRERTAQLVAANQELLDFSYSVSHDLRAPLRHISGFTDLLVQHPLVASKPEVLRLAAIIHSAAGRMGQLIDDLLIFSRMSRIEMKRDLVSMATLVHEVVRECSVDTAGREIVWKIGALQDVVGDAAMLRQVWSNLIVNAIKYTRYRSQAVIEIQSQQTDAGVVFFVRDNGAGFDMQYADKLFGIFQRLHRDEEFEGTGIGLASVRRIIHRHGGQTWAIGAVDKGATVSFMLPATPAVASER